MDDAGKVDVPMLSASIPSSLELNSASTNFDAFTGSWEDNDNEAKNQHLLSLWIKKILSFSWLHACGGANGWARAKSHLIKQFTFEVLKPYDKIVQRWNQFFVISCLFAIFIDPLFFFLLSVNKDHKCIVFNWPMSKTIVVFRSITDFIYLMNMLVQFRLAFVGAGDLVDNPRRIAIHYLFGFFFLDLIILLPLPQIIVLFILPNSFASSRANDAKNLLRLAVLVQYIPRLYRFLLLLTSQSLTTFIFESAWANFIINLLPFVMAGHVVGSCWYLFGLQRVYQCLRDACSKSGFINCKKCIDCGHGDDFGSFKMDPTWTQNLNSGACFSEDGFPYGIYVKAVNLSAENSIITRYVYSFFWGFQQISTLAGNLTPSYFVGEVLFAIGVIVLGLLLFALLFGNMQNILQGIGRRWLEMSLRQRDVEQWMSHRHLPGELRREIRESQRYNWAATHGFDEETLMKNLPEDLQKHIRRHLFKFVKKVGIFEHMDESTLDAICERATRKTYIKGTTFYASGYVTHMVFIVRGKMESIEEDGNRVALSKGDACGEELLKWYLQPSSLNGDTRNQKESINKLASKRTLKCLTNVEAFVLEAADVEQVITLCAGHMERISLRVDLTSDMETWWC